MKKRLILIMVFLSFNLFSQVGKNGFEILTFPFYSRIYALSGSAISVVDDVNASLLDPSRLSSIKGLEACASGNILIDDSQSGSFSVAYPMPFGTFGFTASFLDYGPVEIRDDDTSEPDRLFSPKESLYVVSFGNTFFNLFAFGMNVKYFTQVLTENHYLSGFAVDISTHYADLLWKGFTPALSINNLGSSGKSQIPLPFSVVFGLNKKIEFNVPLFGVSDIRPSFEMRWSTDRNIRVGVGLETMWYHVAELLDITGRISWAWPADAGFLSGLKAGVGIKFKRYVLDYGLGLLGDMGFVHNIAFTFKWEEPEPARYIRNITDKKIEKTLDEIDKKFEQDEKKRE